MSRLGFSASKSFALAAALAFTAATAAGQDTTQTPSSTQSQNPSSQNGWKRFNGGWSNQPNGAQRANNTAPAPSPTTAVQLAQNPGEENPQAGPNGIRPDNGSQEPAPFPPPLVIQPGTIVIVRMNQALSSDHNQVGDVFSATLVQPVVVHGIVVAQRGQTVAGRVMEAKKAGMVSGVSHLAIALTSLTLADGQGVPIQSQLLVQKGPTSKGRDAAAVAGTTALGAAIGAAADWGTGAAIGAGAGAVASTIGVLLTRGYPTVVYPETQLTFQLTAAVPVDTDYAPQAFHAVNSADYPQAQSQPQQAPPPPAAQGPPPPAPAYPSSYPYYVYGPPYYPYYYPYYGYGYPFYYGPSFSFVFGPYGYYGHGYYGHYHGGGYHGGGFHGGGFHGGGGHGGHH